MAKYKTGMPELVNAAQRISDDRELLDGKLKELNQLVDALEAFWQGPAKSEFVKLNSRFDGDVRILLRAMAEIATQLSGTVKLYARQEDVQVQAFSAVSARLNG